MIPHNSPKSIAAFLAGRGLALKKRFGQNFLIDAGLRRKILTLLGPRQGIKLWEIGPGLGSMTLPILEAGARVRAFEIDRGFIAILREEFAGYENFFLTEGDALAAWPVFREEEPETIFGNLPYRSAAALIADFLEKDFTASRWVFMVQKEVALRMAAQPGTKDYSSFSLLTQTFMDVHLRFDVPPAAFYPRPGVVSTVVELFPRKDSPALAERSLFTEVLRALFSSRRKTLKNNLIPWAAGRGIDPAGACRLLESSGLNASARGENLSPEDVARLSNLAAEFFGLASGPK